MSRRPHRKASGPLAGLRLDAKRRRVYTMYLESVPMREIAEQCETTVRQITDWVNQEIRKTEVLDITELKDKRAKLNAQLETIMRKALIIARNANQDTKEGRDFFAQASKTVNETVKSIIIVNGMDANKMKDLGKGIGEALPDALIKAVAEAGFSKPKQAEIVDHKQLKDFNLSDQDVSTREAQLPPKHEIQN